MQQPYQTQPTIAVGRGARKQSSWETGFWGLEPTVAAVEVHAFFSGISQNLELRTTPNFGPKTTTTARTG